MKKFLVLALVAMISATGFSKTLDEVFNAFPQAENVREITLDKAMLMMARNAGGDRAKDMKNIDVMRVIAIEDATAEQVKIAQELMNEGVDGFDVMVDANENDEQALILTQGGDKLINKMLIMAITKEEVAIVLIEGKIDPENATNLANMAK